MNVPKARVARTSHLLGAAGGETVEFAITELPERSHFYNSSSAGLFAKMIVDSPGGQ